MFSKNVYGISKILNKIHRVLKRISTGRNIWILAIIALALSIVMLVVRIPDGLANLMGYSGQQGMFAPDAVPFTNGDKVYSILALYGDAGRSAYVYTSLLFDLVYPVSYALLLATGFTALLGGLLPENSPWQKLSLFPLLAGILDLLENLSFYILIFEYPSRLDWLAGTANFLTSTKGVLGYSSAMILLAGWFVSVIARRKVAIKRGEVGLR